METVPAPPGDAAGNAGTAAELRRALDACEAARAEAERRARQQAQRYELLLTLATQPDLSLEAPSVITTAPETTPVNPAAAGVGRNVDDSGPASVGDVRTAIGGPDTLAVTLSGSLDHVAHVIRAGLGVRRAGILLFDPVRGGLVPAVGLGGGNVVDTDDGTVRALLDRRVFRSGESLVLTTRKPDPEGREVLRALGAAALLAVPLVVEGEPRGVLAVADSRADALGGDDVTFLGVLAARVSQLIERAELISAQREVERQRAQAAARQEFLGIVTHELKTPVAVLRAYTELLLGRAQQAGRTEEAGLLARIDDQAERLLGMVEQVLDLQRLDVGLLPLEIGRVDLGALARLVVEELQLTNPQVRLRAAVVETGDAGTQDAERTTPERARAITVRADRRRIEQVLVNLVQNAIRFSPPDGQVDVQVRRDNPADRAGRPRALVSVRDHGPGVSDGDRARIFDRFFQGKGGAGLHRGHGGLGVGLYIAREIASRHGGDLWLEPPGHGSGATFTFALPVAGPDDPERPHETA